MLGLLLAGVGLIAVTKKPTTTQVSAPRTTASGSPTQSGTVTSLGQTSKQGISASAPRANQGAKNSNANQPWYTGAITAGGGLALTAGAKALTGIFSSAGDDGDTYDSASEEINDQISDDDSEFYEDANTDSDSWDVDPDAGQGDYYADDSEGDTGDWGDWA